MAEQLTIRVDLLMRTMSESNLRGHWTRHHKRHQNQRGGACLLTRIACITERRRRGKPELVVMCRVAPRLLDAGNVAAALKHVQDGVADGLEVNDGDRAIRWVYEQRQGPYAVEVDITWAAEVSSGLT